MTTEKIEGGDYLSALRYEPIDDDDVRYVSVQLTEEQWGSLADDVANNLVTKADVGARLFFALYHHPKIVEIVSNDDYWTGGMAKAYMAGQRAFLSDGR